MSSNQPPDLPPAPLFSLLHLPLASSPAFVAAIVTGILSALLQEQVGLLDMLQMPRKLVHAGRDFWSGELHGKPVVLALSRIGKVAAATTAAALIERFQAGRIVFTGVAGGLKTGVNVGDVVVAGSFVQHDMDASPLFPRYEVPLYGRSGFSTDGAMTGLLLDAAHAAFTINPSSTTSADSSSVRVHLGLIASGDRFMGAAAGSQALQNALLAAGHDALAVEMEGAAVAQVCHDYGLPFAAVRTISDRADDSAHLDFEAFIDKVAGGYACRILSNFLKLL